MLKLFFPVTLALLAGCAGTQQATVSPPVDRAPVPAVAVQLPETAPVPTLVVADVTQAVPAAAPAQVPASAPAAKADAYQCMLSWAKGMQDAMAPWATTAQRCEPRAIQP